MNWHETIISIRENSEFKDLVRLAYFDENLKLNVERFGKSEEFKETLNIIKQHLPIAKSILDIGAGNGISSVCFALKGYNVTAVEPDSSNTVGANAIRQLKQVYNLDNLVVHEKYAEEIGFEANSFDIVYVRQAMHHAYELKKFISECARVLKPNGILLTVRDHVIFDAKDKEWFLASHPLHKFYGGENAFTPKEYKDAMLEAGLRIIKEIKYYESVINYFPLTKEDKEKQEKAVELNLRSSLKRRIGIIANLPIIFNLYKQKLGIKDSFLNEKMVPGRMYSYISKKV